jgi:hypothetical protein
MSLLSPKQADRDSFERLFNDERRKRKSAEEKLAKVQASAEKVHSSQLQEQSAELQIELTVARKKLTALRKKSNELETRSKLWQEESEETKSELLKRSLAFEKSIAQQQRKIHAHVQEYITKTQDQAHWEV